MGIAEFVNIKLFLQQELLVVEKIKTKMMLLYDKQELEKNSRWQVD